MPDQRCPVCGSTMDTDWIEITNFADPKPTYIPGQQQCPNRCDPKVARLLTREDGPVWDATGNCISLGLTEEIKTITGDPNATLHSVINHPDHAWRRDMLYRIRLTADRLDATRANT